MGVVCKLAYLCEEPEILGFGGDVHRVGYLSKSAEAASYLPSLREFANDCTREEVTRSDAHEVRGMSPEVQVPETGGGVE